MLGALISTIRILRVSTIDIGHSLYDIVLTLLCTPAPALPLSGTRIHIHCMDGRTPYTALYGLLTFKTALAKPALENPKSKSTSEIEPSSSFTATKWVSMLSPLRLRYAFAPTIRVGAVYCRHQ